MEILGEVDRWLGDVTLEPTTLRRYVYSLGKLVSFGVRTVEEIDRPRVRAFMVAQREHGLSANTCNRDLAAVCSFVRWEWERGNFQVERYAELQRSFYSVPPPPTPYYLAPSEYLRLRRAACDVHDFLELAVGIAVYAGPRLGELRRIHGSDFLLSPDRGPSSDGKSFLKVPPRKTGRPRTVPIVWQFADELAARGLPSGPLFPSRRRKGEVNKSSYVVEGTVEEWLWTARQEAELPDATWTALRHTFASWQVQGGTSIAKVAGWLGHGIGVCYRHYAALIPGGDVDASLGFRRLGEAS